MRLFVRIESRYTRYSVSPLGGRFVSLEQIMKVQGRTSHESSVKWINVLCVSTGLVVGIIMVTPFLTGEESDKKPPKEAVRFSLADDSIDGTVATRKRAPIVHRNVDRLRENGLRYQQPETGLRNENSTPAAPRALDPSKDPVISTIPKAPIISSSEAIALRKQRDAAREAAKAAEQRSEVVAEVTEQQPSKDDASVNQEKPEDLVATQKVEEATPKSSGFALPDLDLPAIELPTIELPDLAKVFEFGSEEAVPPHDNNEPKIDADAIVRQHLQKQEQDANGPLQPDMNLIAEGNLPAINYPAQQLPGLSKNMALVPRLDGSAATHAAQASADDVTTQLADQLVRDIDMGSSFVPTPMRVQPELKQTEPEVLGHEKVAVVPSVPMNDAKLPAELPTENAVEAEPRKQPEEKPQAEQLAASKPSTGFSFPEINLPVLELPAMTLPEFELPSFELPQMSFPEFGSTQVQQASSDEGKEVAAPAVAVQQTPAPIVNGDQKSAETQLPPMPVVEKPIEQSTEGLTPATPPNRLRKQPEFARPLAP